jgi:serine/threonine-protein phosphatase 5
VYAEPTMVEVGVESGKKLTVCGDTHGMSCLPPYI